MLNGKLLITACISYAVLNACGSNDVSSSIYLETTSSITTGIESLQDNNGNKILVDKKDVYLLNLASLGKQNLQNEISDDNEEEILITVPYAESFNGNGYTKFGYIEDLGNGSFKYSLDPYYFKIVEKQNFDGSKSISYYPTSKLNSDNDIVEYTKNDGTKGRFYIKFFI
ncbi:MAG: hypothetical protein ACI4V7_01735 [Succinivibrionaceae bacterium]